MTHFPLTTIQGAEITLTFLKVVDQMLWSLTPNLECFLEITSSPSPIPPTLFGD